MKKFVPLDRALARPSLRDSSEGSLIATFNLLLETRHHEGRALLALVKRDRVSKAELHRALYEGAPTSDLKTVSVVIYGLRKKLKPFGIRIDLVWNEGYRLTEDGRDKLRELLTAYGRDLIAASTPSSSKAA